MIYDILCRRIVDNLDVIIHEGIWEDGTRFFCFLNDYSPSSSQNAW